MASFQNVNETLELFVPQKGSTVAVAIAGTYNQVIKLQIELGSKGSGAWAHVKQFDVEDATEAFDYVTKSTDETVRLLLSADNGGDATVTLTETSNVLVTTIEDEVGNILASFFQSGPTFPGTIIYSTLNDGTTDLDATVLELNYLDLTTLGTGAASKAVVLDSGDDYIWPATGLLTYGGTQITATGAEVNYLDLTTLGTGAASKAVVLDASSDYTYPSGGTFTLAGTNTLSGLTSLTGNILETEGGPGIVGTAEIYKTSVVRVGGIIKTEIMIDVTGLNSDDDDNDIIGKDADGAAYIGRITTARNGTIWKGRMHCLELPATGDPNIALWSATENTGVEDTLIGALTSTEMVQSHGDGTDWVAGDEIALALLPAPNQYLYLVQGDGTGTDGTYSAGRFLIEFWGV